MINILSLKYMKRQTNIHFTMSLYIIIYNPKIISISMGQSLEYLSSWHLTPEVLKHFSYSTQLSTKFILLINVKMPTIVGILIFMSTINATSGKFKARNIFNCRYFSFYEQLEIRAQLSWAWIKFYILGARIYFWKNAY